MDSEPYSNGLSVDSAAKRVIPFPAISSHSYGLQAGSTPLLAELVTTLHATFDKCQPHAMAAAAKTCLRGYLCEPELLTPAQKQGAPHMFRRHLLYAAPDKSFSVLALVWKPGQHTAIHGHSNWGAFGVLSGKLYCEDFKLERSQAAGIWAQPNMTMRLQAADMATVEPGIEQLHRIGNDGLATTITLHVYGGDLLAAPTSINIFLNEITA